MIVKDLLAAMSETGICHVMIRGINRQIIFEDGEDYCKFLKALKITKEKCIHVLCNGVKKGLFLILCGFLILTIFKI